jgi:hypothetical protein
MKSMDPNTNDRNMFSKDNNYSSFEVSFRDDHNEKNSRKILCCGGDGTIRWIMDTARYIKDRELFTHSSSKKSFNSYTNITNNNDIHYGIIPLGTGNDLYNHFYQHYFIKTAPSLLRTDRLLTNTYSLFNQYIHSNQSLPLDRWHMSIQKPSSLVKKVFEDFNLKLRIQKNEVYVKRRRMKRLIKQIQRFFLNIFKSFSSSNTATTSEELFRQQQMKSKSAYFNNYFGIGIDGGVTYSYHNFRNHYRFLFIHRIINKLFYAMVWIYKLCRGKIL